MARRGSRRTTKPSKSSKAAKAQRGGQQRKGVDDRGAEQPTPEMLSRVEYEYGAVKTEMGVQIGSAYRRRPLYLTMAKKADRFTYNQLTALGVYRTVFDRCERSPFASCLAAQQGGGRGVGPASFIHASPAVIEAKRKLALLERGLGQTLQTMRDVVLHDKSFSVIAMERFGYRTRSWIRVDEPVLRNGKPVVVDGKPLLRAVHREDVVPRSGRDRERVADEFNRGLKLLTTAAMRLAGADIDEIWVHPREDGTAIIHRASIAPTGLFRMWGPAQLVRYVIDALLEKNADRLVYETPEKARDALIEADDGRLHRLDPEELAA